MFTVVLPILCLSMVTYQWSWLALCPLNSRGASKTLKKYTTQNECVKVIL